MTQQRDPIFASLRWETKSLPAAAAGGTVEVVVGRAGRGDPQCLITCGVHGDEGGWGALAVQRLLELPQGALLGSITTLLAANPLAEEADARNAPLDSLDLNRTFPGRSDGSHTERLASVLASLAAGADVVIDLHGGGSWCVNAFAFAFPGSEDLASLIGAPFVTEAAYKAGSLTHFAADLGAKVLAVEMGGRSRDELVWAARIADGLKRVLKTVGVLAASVVVPPPPTPTTVGPSQVLRPPSGGLFVPAVREDAVGISVPRRTLLGEVLNMKTLAVEHRFEAPYDETAILLLRPHVSVIEGGAMTYVVAEPRK